MNYQKKFSNFIMNQIIEMNSLYTLIEPILATDTRSIFSLTALIYCLIIFRLIFIFIA